MLKMHNLFLFFDSLNCLFCYSAFKYLFTIGCVLMVELQLMGADQERAKKLSQSFNDWANGLIWPDTPFPRLTAPRPIKRGTKEVQLDLFEARTNA